MKTAKEWIELFEKNNFLDTKNWKETIPTLTIIGGCYFGTNDNGKEKIKEWIGIKKNMDKWISIDISRNAGKIL